MQEMAPIIKSGAVRPSEIIAFITYSGEVPISPKTIPSVIKIPATLTFFRSSDFRAIIKSFKKTAQSYTLFNINVPPQSTIFYRL